MNTTEKGNIGEAFVIQEALKKGYQISIPFSHNSRYDLVLEKNDALLKVQVKYIKNIKGVLRVPLRCSKAYKPRTYEKNDFDILIVYSPDLNKTFCIDYEVLKDNTTYLVLRLEKSKNGQKKNILWAKDFEDW
jgi:PD-(D/E)XK endonuclease